MLIIFLFLCSFADVSQVPKGVKYQAVVRGVNGLPLVSQTIGFEISILQGQIGGAVIYTERFSVASDPTGVVSFNIGMGNPLVGDFGTINWSNGLFFVKTSVDTNNSGIFTLMGESQLMSVPFAMYADKAGNGFSGDYDDLTNRPNLDTKISIHSPEVGDIVYYDGSDWKTLEIGDEGKVLAVLNGKPQWVIPAASSTAKHYIGEFFGGGVVYVVWENGQGVQHGLIVALTDLPSTAPDDDNDGVPDGFMLEPNLSGNINAQVYDQIPNAKSHGDGFLNTKNIADFQDAKGLSGMAAQVARAYNGGGFTDWYMPSTHELSLIYHNLYVVNKSLIEDGNPSTTEITGNYWASSIFNTSQGWNWGMARGYAANQTMHTNRFVRAIRAF